MSDKSHLPSTSIGSFAGRVGHKAGGFISKKFFHPSNYKNQEKLWAAIEEKKEKEKRQEELMKKREEERRVELLKQEMAGSNNISTGSLSQGLNFASGGGLFVSAESHASGIKRNTPSVEDVASAETRRRLALLRSISDQGEGERASRRIVVRSRYPEDIHINGHSAVWGSYYDRDSKRWGYLCCKVLDKQGHCEADANAHKRNRC